jgi:hypothetical protein
LNPSSYKEEIIDSVRGWISAEQLANIAKAIDSGEFDLGTYLGKSAEYVAEKLDNGGFSPRQQYVLEFANNHPWSRKDRLN